MDFLNPLAFYGLLSIIPIIILYLLKPKPRLKDIPSLMFFWNVQRSEKLRSFFKKVIKEPLLLLQILIVAVLVSALATPVLDMVVRETQKEAVAIVIDVSASMTASTPSNRFDEALSTAKGIVQSSGGEDVFGIVLAANVPIVVGSELSKDEALSVLSSVSSRETPTNIISAMALAGDLVRGNDHRRIYVISDFSSTDGGDPVLSAQKLMKENTSVFLKKVGEPSDNIAIVSGKIQKFGKCALDIDVINTGSKINTNMLIKSPVEDRGKAIELVNGINSIEEPISCGGSNQELTVKIDAADSMNIDNLAYFILPSERSERVLLIGKNDPLLFALQSMPGIVVQQSNPPTLPKFDNFEAVILDQFSGNILPGTFDELAAFVRGGGILIVVASERMNDFDGESIIPVKIIDKISGKIDTIDHPITLGVDFGEVETYRVEPKRNGTIIATVKDSPFIFYEKVGSGQVIYIGLLNTTFQLQPSYPIFWIRMFDWFRETMVRTDYRTGELFGNGNGEKPVFLEKTGFFSKGEKEVAVNLFDETESGISKNLDVDKYISDETVGVGMVQKRYDFTWILALLAVLLILLEWRYYKTSGRL